MDFGALQPEINSGLMYTGPGAWPMVAAAAAWDKLGTELRSAALSYQSVIAGLTGGSWQGQASTAMATAVAPYLVWLHTTAAQAEQTAVNANGAAAAFETAFGMIVPPALIAANRSLLMQLIQTNLLGQNAPAIAATESHYDEMWAQDAAAMYGYAGNSAQHTSLSTFTEPPSPVNAAAVPSQAVQTAAGTSAPNIMSTGSSLVSATPNALQGLSTPTSSPTDTSSLSSLSTLQSLMYPAMMGIYPLSMIMGPLMNKALMGATAAGAAASMAPKVVSAIPVAGAALGQGAGALGAAGSALGGGPPVVMAGLGHASNMGALSVPSTWPGAAGPPAATLASSVSGADGVPATGGAGALPYGLMQGAGAAGAERGAAPAKWELGRLTVIPRSTVLG